MIQLAYISTAADTLGSGEVFKIIETSARNNANAGLSGFLIYANNQFFQLIEGPPSAIDELMKKLQRDTRHHSIQIVHSAPIAARSFAKWSMKRVLVPDAQGRIERLMPELATAPDPVKRAASDFLELAVA